MTYWNHKTCWFKHLEALSSVVLLLALQHGNQALRGKNPSTLWPRIMAFVIKILSKTYISASSSAAVL